MQTNGNTSPEGAKNQISLDSIINEFENNGTADDSQKKINPMDKLNEMFRKQEEDLDWLNDFVLEAEEGEESDAEEEQESVSEIIAENAEVEEIHQATDEEISEDITQAIAEAIAGEELPPEEYPDNDGATRQFNAVKEASDEEIGFEMFENDTSEPEEETEVANEIEDDVSDVQEPDEVDGYLTKLFGGSDDDFSEDENVAVAEKKPEKKKSEHKKIAKELGVYEEIDMSDPGAVNAGKNRYYTKKRNALVSLFCVTLCMLVGLYVELAPIASLPHFEILSPANPAVYALVALQVLCFGAICMLESLERGLFAIVDKRFSPASCALVIAAVSALQAVLTAIFSTGSDGVRLFCSVGLLALFMLSASDYLRASADYKAYKIASSTSNKFGAFEIATDSAECEPFSSHIDLEEAKAITVKKGAVYEGFVERNERRPEGEKKLGRLAGIVAIVALVVGVFMAVATKSVYDGYTSAAIVLISSLPINIFFVSALPKYIAAKQGKQIGAALIGQNASEEYKGLSVVTFEDTEVFLPKDVRISSIKTYSGMALDEAVVLMSKIYGKIGGPLSKIFAKMVDTETGKSEVELEKVYPDALWVKVDGKNVCLATSSYLSANGIKIISDSVDTAFEQSHGSILYLVSLNRVMAKFYIKYSVNPNFERTLRELHEANLCVGIKTLDPCINNDLVFGCLERANYALSVVKGSGEEDIPGVCETVSSGVIALGSVHNFLEMLLLCERTGRNVKINNVIKLISTLLCLVLSTAFVLSNSALNVVFCLIIQIFWLLPVAVISYFNK